MRQAFGVQLALVFLLISMGCGPGVFERRVQKQNGATVCDITSKPGFEWKNGKCVPTTPAQVAGWELAGWVAVAGQPEILEVTAPEVSSKDFIMAVRNQLPDIVVRMNRSVQLLEPGATFSLFSEKSDTSPDSFSLTNAETAPFEFLQDDQSAMKISLAREFEGSAKITLPGMVDTFGLQVDPGTEHKLENIQVVRPRFLFKHPGFAKAREKTQLKNLPGTIELVESIKKELGESEDEQQEVHFLHFCLDRPMADSKESISILMEEQQTDMSWQKLADLQSFVTDLKSFTQEDLETLNIADEEGCKSLLWVGAKPGTYPAVSRLRVSITPESASTVLDVYRNPLATASFEWQHSIPELVNQ